MIPDSIRASLFFLQVDYNFHGLCITSQTCKSVEQQGCRAVIMVGLYYSLKATSQDPPHMDNQSWPLASCLCACCLHVRLSNGVPWGVALAPGTACVRYTRVHYTSSKAVSGRIIEFGRPSWLRVQLLGSSPLLVEPHAT